MLNPELYEPIFARKSVRKYAETPLSAAQLGAVKAEIANAVPLLPGAKYKLALGEAKEGWRIYGFCENTPLSNANLGYMLQQLDLALHNQGLGRLWFGMGRSTGGIKAPAGLSYAMCLKVGVAAEPIPRESTGAFDRKPITEVIDNAGLYELFEPVRLAPSARNMQSWTFTEDNGSIHVWRKQPGGMLKMFIDRMNWLDMGISLCHMVLALEHADMKFDIKFEAGKRREDFDYLMTVVLGD